MTPEQNLMKDVFLGMPAAILRSPIMLVFALAVGFLLGIWFKSSQSQWE